MNELLGWCDGWLIETDVEPIHEAIEELSQYQEPAEDDIFIFRSYLCLSKLNLLNFDFLWHSYVNNKVLFVLIIIVPKLTHSCSSQVLPWLGHTVSTILRSWRL